MPYVDLSLHNGANVKGVANTRGLRFIEAIRLAGTIAVSVTEILVPTLCARATVAE